MSQSEGPCGPSGATSGSVTEGRSVAEHDTDPLPSSAAAEVVVAAQGRSGVPTGLSTPDAIASANERTGARTVAPQAPKPVGLDTTGRSDEGAEEDADGVTALLARRVPLVVASAAERAAFKSRDGTSFAWPFLFLGSKRKCFHIVVQHPRKIIIHVSSETSKIPTEFHFSMLVESNR